MKSFKTKYGQFSADGKEYLITSPRTPRPWINVISNGDYGITVSQTGSGYSWRSHAQLNRISRWEQDLIRDEWGKYIYLCDDEGHVWSAGWKPVCQDPDAYLCRHGIGYTTIESRQFGVTTELCMFVPVDEPLELWRLTLRNNTRRPRTINLFSYLEWCLGQAPDWHREFHKSFIETAAVPSAHTLLATKRLWEVPTDRGHWNTEWPYVAFHSASLKPVSYGGDKETFLGMYGSLRLPKAVQEGKMPTRTGSWLDATGSLHLRVRLEPGKETTVTFTLGAADSRHQALALAAKYRRAGAVESALEAVHDRWNKLLGTVVADIPDDAMNLMQNIWLKYQAISGRMWGRTAYYQTGGAFGFRDQLQDSMLWLTIDPMRTLDQIRLHARHQFAEGAVYHWWHPLSEVGLRNSISDNLLWLPFVVNHYLLETNDHAALSLRDRWLDDPVEGTLYEHCVRAIDFSLKRFSPRGLPLIGGGDWNDGLSAVGLDMKGESVWLGHFLHRVLLDFSSIAELRGDNARAAEYRSQSRTLKSALNEHAWDGDWYYGATKDSGEKLGSRQNREGSIWLNPQTWGVIGDVADPVRARHLMDIVEKKLEAEIGPLLLSPAYSTPDKYVGYLTRYSPGMRENGGVYTHASTWAVIMAAMLGRGEAAFRIYSRLNPINRGKQPDRYCAEPYVTPGNIEGPDSAFYGRGGWTWYTGSAAWLYRVGIEWILGIRPSPEGLVIDPCIPAGWKRFSVKRSFRGAQYVIHVENPHASECGVETSWVDGVRHDQSNNPRGTCVPSFPPGTSHEIRVVMGKKSRGRKQ